MLNEDLRTCHSTLKRLRCDTGRVQMKRSKEGMFSRYINTDIHTVYCTHNQFCVDFHRNVSFKSIQSTSRFNNDKMFHAGKQTTACGSRGVKGQLTRYELAQIPHGDTLKASISAN